MKRTILLLTLAISLLFPPVRAQAATDGIYTWPVDAALDITEGFYYQDGTYHGGADFNAPEGSPVYAVAAGTVSEIIDGCFGNHTPGAADACPLGADCPVFSRGGTDAHEGNTIVIDHGNEIFTRYCHLQEGSFQANVGDRVEQGQRIASTGNTGVITLEPHLHFAMIRAGNAVSAEEVLTRRNTADSSHNPVLSVEVVEEGEEARTLHVRGWTYDPDDSAASLEVNIYISDDAGIMGELAGTLTADRYRQDVDAEYQCGAYHGFEGTLPAPFSGTVAVWLEAVNTGEGFNTMTPSPLETDIDADTSPPVIENVAISNISTSGYTVSVTVSDNVGVVRVEMPSWVGSWPGSVDVVPLGTRRGDTWTCTIPRRNEPNAWQTSVRAYDAAGNVSQLVSVIIRALTLTFDPNGGVCSVATQTAFSAYYMLDYSRQTFTAGYENLPTPTRDGYSFDGWYTRSAGGERVAPSTRITTSASHTLYAHWTRVDTESPSILGVSVSDFSIGGYTVAVSAADNQGVSAVRMRSWAGTFDSRLPWEDAEPSSADSWSMSVIRAGESGTWRTEARAFDRAGNQSQLVSVYVRPLTVSFNLNGGLESSIPASQTVFNAYSLVNYQNQTYFSAYGELPEPLRNGYTFAGWYTAPVGGEIVTASTMVRAEADHSLYARWISGGPTGTPVTPGVTATPTPTPVSGTTPTPTPTTEPTVPAGTPRILMGTGSTRPGGTARIAVFLSDNPGIISMRLRLRYDRSVLTLTDVQDGGLLGQFESGRDLTPMPYILSWSNDTAAANRTASGTIVTLSFAVSEQAAERTYPVQLFYDNTQHDIFNKDYQPVEFTVSNGGVKVSGLVPGDANRDGAVTPLDRVFVARHLAGWGGYTELEVDLDAADVSGDNRVTGVDRTILARHLAGWKGYETLPYIAGQSAALFAENAVLTAAVRAQGSAVRRGENAAVTLSLEDNPGIISMLLKIDYPDALELVEVSDAGLLGGESMHNPDRTANPYRLEWGNDTGENSASNGRLVTLFFRLKEEAEAGNYPVSVSCDSGEIYNFDMAPVEFELESATVQFYDSETDTPPVSFGTVSRVDGGIQAEISCQEDGIILFCAAYGETGKLLQIARPVETAETGTREYHFHLGAGYKSVKLFALDSRSRPLCEAKQTDF